MRTPFALALDLKKFSTTLCCTVGALAFLAMPNGTNAQTIISVNFQGTNSVALAPTDTTGPFSAANWNNVTGATGGPVVLNDSTGLPSLVTLTSYAAGLGAEGGDTDNSTPQKILFGGALIVNFGDATFTLGGLSVFSSYSIVPIFSGGPAFPGSRETDFTVSQTGSPTYYASNIDSVYTAFTQSNSTTNSTFDPGNYVVFSGLTAASQTVTMQYVNNQLGLIGFQVIGTALVPEPSTYAMLVLGATAVFFFGRRARSRKLS